MIRPTAVLFVLAVVLFALLACAGTPALRRAPRER
jgi:hypothetical protein